jgi:hypothetical protein
MKHAPMILALSESPWPAAAVIIVGMICFTFIIHQLLK